MALVHASPSLARHHERAPAAAGRPSSGGRLAALRDSIRAGWYLSVASSPRFRAVQRRRTVAASRAGFLLIAAAAAFDAAALIDLEQGLSPLFVALNGVVVVIAIGGYHALARGWRRRPEPVVALVTLALTFATAATGFLLPRLTLQTIGYLILLPGLIALIVPWGTRSHLRWLLAYAVIALGYFATGPSGLLTIDDRSDLVIVGVIAVATSLAGHVLLQRAQIRNHVQLRKIHELHRRADQDMAELARVHRELEITARVDALTGAGNRIRMHEDLLAARARMGRLKQSHGLVAIDLDHFKQVNDRFGHLAGDSVLRHVVELIEEAMRKEDAVYRFGGEEFLVLMRVSTPEDLASAMERLRQAVAQATIPHPDNAPANVVTISLGGVLVTPDDLVETDDDWLAKADEALYRAKANGRNRIELAS